MKAPQLTPELSAEYTRLLLSLEPGAYKSGQIASAAARVLAGRERYEEVAMRFRDVPWHFIGLIHLMECSCDFSLHLHNGDSLKRRTVNVPAGRPATGQPPFTWLESAVDALRFDRVDRWRDWTVAGMLFQLEGFNGWGYRMYHPNVPSPYLWAGSRHYRSGKYVADGKWSDSAVSKQIGAAVVLHQLCISKAIALRGIRIDQDGGLLA